MKTIILIIYILFIIPGLLLSQVAHGFVFGKDAENNKVPLPKATVLWLNTNDGTLTDNQGHFSIKPSKETNQLVVSYAGYKKDTIQVTNFNEHLEIVLVADFTTSEIEISAKQPDLIISKSDITKSEVITARGLTKAACCNLAESFVANPSIDVAFTDAVTGAKQIQILGLQGIYSQMLTEQIPNLYGLAATYGLNYIPGPWMEAIYISKGTSSVKTGPESITSQINIEFKKPENSEPMFLNFYGDDYGRFEANVNGRYFLNDNLSTAILAHGSLFEYTTDRNNDGFLDKPLTRQLNIFNRWLYEIPTFEVRFGVKAMLDERESGQTSYFKKNQTTAYYNKNATQRYEAFGKFGFLFPEHPNRSIGVILNAIHHNQKSNFGNRVYDALQNTLYGNIIFTSEFNDDLQYTIGGSMKFDNYDERLEGNSIGQDESMAGVFLEVNYKPFDEVEIQAGSRYDYHNLFNGFFTPRIHVKYSPDDAHSIRFSAGKGFRSARPIAENIGVLVSSRQLRYNETQFLEEAWNYGFNTSSDFNLFNFPFTLNLELYRTDFINQLIVDTEQDVHSIFFYNLNGKSYSNSFQADVNFEPISGLTATIAYRFNDVHITMNNELIRKPLTSAHKGFINLAYATPNDEWKFDITGDYNGGGNMPRTDTNPPEYQLPEKYPSFVLLNAQITKSFKNFELYIGGENLGDFRQLNPIISADNPNSEYFDGTMIWGPILGRMLYAGIRLTMFN